MPWYNGSFPPSYKNQPPEIRAKAVEIANELLLQGFDEGVAIATGLKKARQFFEDGNDAKALKEKDKGS
jgi:uncharacterized protein YdaT